MRSRASAAASSAAQQAGRGGLEDREDAVAHELQDLAPLRLDRSDHRVRIVVEQRDDLLGRSGVGDPGKALEVAEPQNRADLLGYAPLDVASQDTMARIAAQIGLDQGLGDTGDGGTLDDGREARHQELERREVIVVEA
jgi:hypothetical protein